MTSCQEPSSQTQVVADPIEQAIKRLQDQGYKISRGQPRTFLDGTIHHHGLVLQKNGKPRRFGVLPDGQVLSEVDANKAYQGAYFDKYGNMRLHAAYQLERIPDQPQTYAIWFDPQSDQVELFKQKVLALDPEAKIRTSGPPIAFMKTTPNILAESGLSKMAATASIYPLSEPQEYSCTSLPSSNSPQWGSAKWSGTANAFNSQGYFGDGIKVGIVEVLSQDTGIWDGHIAFAQTGGIFYQNTPDQCSIDSDCIKNQICRLDQNGTPRCVSEHTSLVASRIAYTSDNGKTPHHAAKSTLYIANGGDLEAHLGDLDWSNVFNTLVERYEWLISENNVKIINESWGMARAHMSGIPEVEATFETFHDSLNTWYTFHKAVTFVRAAGPGNLYEEADCHALNSICVAALDAKCTYADYTDDEFKNSAWRNPHNHYKFSFNPQFGQVESLVVPGLLLGPEAPDTQVERPDVIAEGHLPIVLDLYPNPPQVDHPDATNYAHTVDNTQYARTYRPGYPDSLNKEEVTGNSFSAPVIAGMIALCAEVEGYVPGARANKTYTRISATTNHSMHSALANGLPNILYPTYTITDWNQGIAQRKYVQDYLAGAGIINADQYYRWCEHDYSKGKDPEEGDGPDGSDWDEGETTLDLNNGDPVPDGVITATPAGSGQNHVQPDGTSTIQQMLRTQNPPSNGYHWRSLNGFGAAQQGDRIRVVATFDACPEGSLANGPHSVETSFDLRLSNPPGVPSVDIDLALCDVADGDPVCEVFSESAIDSVEGFDVVVSRNYNDLKVYAMWPLGQSSCFGNSLAPITWASIHWYSR